ncbi:MAG: Hsp20/alpha crystallin family protein [Candidatus Njordarchaeales archaeon]
MSDDRERRSDPFLDFIISLFSAISHGIEFESEEYIPTTVIEDNEGVRIYMDIPGLAKDSIEVLAKNDLLLITGLRYNRKFRKTIKIPKTATDKVLSVKYNNGVLELVLQKRIRRKLPMPF